MNQQATRAKDPVFAAAEQLFRSVSDEDISGGGVDPASIDLPLGHSVNREKYAPDPLDARDLQRRPTETGVVAVRAGDLPAPVLAQSGQVTYEYFVEDWPEVFNAAHAEIRVKRQGKPYKANLKIKNEVTRKSVRAALALKMYIVVQPT